MRFAPRPAEILLQALVLGAVVGVLLFFLHTARERMAAQGIPFSFAFLAQEAGFSLSEGLTYAPGEGLRPYTPSDTYWQAFLAGFLNTLRVAVAGLVLATLLGFAIGAARLSRNPLARGLGFLYVELVRNTPLLLQLFVWYFAVLLKLPPVEGALRFLGIWLSQRGLFLPWIEATPKAYGFLLLLLGTALAVWGLRRYLWAKVLLPLVLLAGLLFLWPPSTFSFLSARPSVSGGGSR